MGVFNMFLMVFKNQNINYYVLLILHLLISLFTVYPIRNAAAAKSLSYVQLCATP